MEVKGSVLVELRSRKILFTGWVVLFVLNLLDIWSTHRLLGSVPGAYEANPVTAWLLDRGLMDPMKIIFVCAIGFYCIRTVNPKRLAVSVWVSVGVYAYVVLHNLQYIIAK